MTQSQREWVFKVTYALQANPRYKGSNGKESTSVDSEKLDSICETLRDIAERDGGKLLEVTKKK